MSVKQISVLLGNVPGSFAKLTHILDSEDISTKAVSAASTTEDSRVRLVVNDPDRAAALLAATISTLKLRQCLQLKSPYMRAV